MKKHLAIKIFGRVQGVGFRYYTREKVLELALFGFARNELDSTVYIEVEGEEDNLKKFLAWCKKGPETAFVSKLEFIFTSDINNFSDFKVL